MNKIKGFVKKNYKIVIGFILGIIVCVGIGVSAVATKDITYDNSTSGLTSTNLQGAIDELNTKATTKINEAKNECPDGYECIKRVCKVISGTGSNIGDEITCGTESFYVIDSSDNTIKMLAKYNLAVGHNWSMHLSSDRLNPGSTPMSGTTIQNQYCTGGAGTIDGTYYDTATCTEWDIGANAFSSYKSYLKNIGLNVIKVRYMTSSDLISLGCTTSTDARGNQMAGSCVNTGYNWLYTTNYFLEDEFYYYSEGIEQVSMGTRGSVSFRLSTEGDGYRPVVEIDKSII